MDFLNDIPVIGPNARRGSIPFLIVLSVVVAIHELGHLMVGPVVRHQGPGLLDRLRARSCGPASIGRARNGRSPPSRLAATSSSWATWTLPAPVTSRTTRPRPFRDAQVRLPQCQPARPYADRAGRPRRQLHPLCHRALRPCPSMSASIPTSLSSQTMGGLNVPRSSASRKATGSSALPVRRSRNSADANADPEPEQW